MARSMNERWRVPAALAAGWLAVQLAMPPVTTAQAPGFQGWRADRDTDPHTRATVDVSTGPNGVDFRISVERGISGDGGRDDAGERHAGPSPSASAPDPVMTGGTAPTGNVTHIWNDG